VVHITTFRVAFSVDAPLVRAYFPPMANTSTRKPSLAEMERARLSRDPSYDGIFWIGVKTTGIFCRPTCPARTPLAKNVEYYHSVKAAMFNGLRPCKRCRPLEAAGTNPAWADSLLSRLQAAPDQRIRDADLRAMGIEPARARRYFQQNYGMTFHAFARGWRLRGAFQLLKKGADLDQVALEHGYESHSGFRDAFHRLVGSPPGSSRNSDCVTISWIESPLGPLVVGATDAGVCLLEFSDRRMLETQFETLRKRFGAILPGNHPLLDQLRIELKEYFEGQRKRFEVPLVFPGSPFQVKVWSALQEIGYGETRSYEQLAWAVGVPNACRAVGHANGQNRIAIVIPCHRVVNKGGKLGGYGGGLWRKQLLLNLEQGIRSELRLEQQAR
jgi:AraC family transcriptional regulator, regulatory protein of adaptative response / methylated-DNA-[protein]-cysteine methyltransferase